MNTMSKLTIGILCGLAFGALAAGSMIPMSFPDKRTAITAAFLNRFSIGLVIGASELPFAPWLNGMMLGLLLSLPAAIITKAWAPILILGTIGGVVIGYVVGIR